MRRCRCFFSLLLVLALVLGTVRSMPAAAEKQHVAQALELVMDAMASDTWMLGVCDKCIKKNPAIHACFGVCVGLQAVLPAVLIQRYSAKAALAPFAERQFDGSVASLDPPPPKLSVFA